MLKGPQRILMVGIYSRMVLGTLWSSQNGSGSALRDDANGGVHTTSRDQDQE